ncbi:MAG: hypothetical protein QF437_28330 [Planctomycetota bacterium]|nr:hypothetical protein [Planctomycetota bacterium]
MKSNIALSLAGLLTFFVSGVDAQFSREGTEALRRMNAKNRAVSTATYNHVKTSSPRLILRGEDRQAELDKAVARALAKYKASLARVPATAPAYTQYRGLNNSFRGLSHCYGTRYVVPKIYHLGGPGGRIIVSPQIKYRPGIAPYRYYGVDSGPCGTSVVIIRNK